MGIVGGTEHSVQYPDIPVTIQAHALLMRCHDCGTFDLKTNSGYIL